MQEATLKVWIADHSQNDAEALASTLRNAGYRIRTTAIGSHGELDEKLAEDTPDLVLCAVDLELLPLDKCTAACAGKAPEIPVIAIAEDPDDTALAAAISFGARDMVRREASDHLQQVVGRELEVARHRRALAESRSEAEESRALADTFLDSSTDGVAYIHEGIHGQVNSAYAQRFGFELPAEVEGLPVLEFIAKDDRDAVKKRLREFDKGQLNPEPMEVTMQTMEGESFKVSILMQEVQHEGERTLRLLVPTDTGNPELEAVHDALKKEFNNQRERLQKIETEYSELRESHQILQKEQEELNSKLKTAAKKLEENKQAAAEVSADGGSQARAAFLKEADALIESPPDSGKAGLVCFSVDKYDELLGQVGFSNLESFVSQFGKAIEKHLDKGEKLYRISDQGFAVCLTRDADKEIEKWANDVLHSVNGNLVESGTHSTSMGASAAFVRLSSAEDADTALTNAWSAASAAGEGSVTRAAGGKSEASSDDEKWIDLITTALEKERFQLVYQPIAALDGSATERYVVRIRMLGEDGTEYAPEEFMPAAERGDLMRDIDRWVIDKTLAVAAERGAEASDATFFMKLSEASVTTPDILDWIAATLEGHKGMQATIMFEVAQNVVEKHLKTAANIAKGLQKLKCGFAVDNFGVDKSGLNTIKHVPMDFLKLEGAFIAEMKEDPDKREHVQAIIDLAKENEIQTIAGQVEDANSLATLWQLGINFIQGNYVQEAEVVLDSDGGGFHWNGEEKQASSN
jgi:multidomain signaling protein FimX